MPATKRTLIIAAALLTTVVAAVAVTSYHEIAIRLAPRKRAATVRTAAALTADSLFWRTFHSGDYDGIPPVAEALTAAYLATPADAVTAAHVAWLHNWRTAERARHDSVPATITDDINLAGRYFEEAVALPRETSIMTSGSRSGATHPARRDRRLAEFNLFTAGYIISRLPSDASRFRQAVEWE